MSITFHDVERLQALYPDHQIELREGNIVIMSPSDSVSGEVGVQFSTLLNVWVRKHNLGRVFDASTGFRLMIFPGVTALWPLFLMRWIEKARQV